MNEKQINWGIIGCGDVAEVKSGPAFQEVSNSNLVAVMRRNASKAKDFAKRHHVPQWYSDADELLKNKNINAVYIATPPSSHLQIALKAMESGKDIYIEKPMVLNQKEAQILIQASKNSNCKITVAHYRRALPAFIKVQELLGTGAIGEVRLAEIRILQPLKSDIIADTEDNWRIVPSESGGGYFFDLAPHQIDLMLKYFGEVKSTGGFGSNLSQTYEANDIVTGILKFESGVHFSGTWAFNINEAQKEDTCKIYGSDGYIEFSFYGEEVKLVSPHSETFKFSNPKNIQLPMIERTVNYFLGKNSLNPCSIFEAAKVIQIMNDFSSQSI
jgi:predicted dehydrogenase